MPELAKQKAFESVVSDAIFVTPAREFLGREISIGKPEPGSILKPQIVPVHLRIKARCVYCQVRSKSVCN